MDLMALNLQRGRDHGLPSYVEYRSLCGLPELRTWRQLAGIVSSPEVRDKNKRFEIDEKASARKAVLPLSYE